MLPLWYNTSYGLLSLVFETHSSQTLQQMCSWISAATKSGAVRAILKSLFSQDCTQVAVHLNKSFPESFAIITGLSHTTLGVRDHCLVFLFFGGMHNKAPPPNQTLRQRIPLFPAPLLINVDSVPGVSRRRRGFCLNVGHKQVWPLVVHICVRERFSRGNKGSNAALFGSGDGPGIAAC